MRRCLLTVVILGFVALVQPANAAEPRVALVIGNSAYAVAPLVNPANDARLMSETLRGLGFDVIERIDADREAIQNAVFELQDRLFEAGQDAVGLFYYAGHGVQVDGQNYLIPLGSDIEKEREVAVKAVSAGFVLGQLEVTGNRMNFVILDACRNNPLTRSFRSATRGLARMDAPRGSLIAYSTGPGDVAADGIGTNSPYTLALAQAMGMPGVPAEQMFKLVRDQVIEETDGEQTPWEESSLTGANFYFKVSISVTVDTPSATTNAAAATQQETAFWESIEDSTNAEMFEAYLDQYPTGAFAALARIKFNELRAPVQSETQAETQTATLVPPPEPAVESAVEPAVGIYPPAYQPGDTFKDCDNCPEMVVVPAGSFRMGNLTGGGSDNERPVHEVTIPQPFAAGVYEVTFRQWDGCVAGGGCGGYRPNDRGWGRGERPVINVSWKDAKSYVAWLSREAGHEYRLLSEAEWEYAARAGTTTKYHWGNRFDSGRANNWSQTVPVGEYPTNAFGLHDMHGNVWEWVEDCWHYSYAGAPSDGQPWTSGGHCDLRVLRGGSWYDNPRSLRAASRYRDGGADRYDNDGFRIARTLLPLAP